MTIASETNRSGPYACNGATTHFPYAFRIYDAAHVRVILTDPQGIETSLALGTDYAVSGVGEVGGGVVETALAYPAGCFVTLILNVPFTQEVDLENQGAYFAETIERAIDQQTQMSLQLKEQVARAVVLPVTSSVSVGELTGAVLSLAQIQPQMSALAPIAQDIKTVAGISGAVVAAGSHADAAAVAAGVATSKAAEAAASAEAAKRWDPARYSTTAEIEEMLSGYSTPRDVSDALSDYTPKTRKLVAGEGITVNGGSEADLSGDVTIAVSIAGVPTGAVMGFGLSAPPPGWIVGDGAAINRAVYAALDAAMYVGDAQNATASAWYRCTNPASPSTSRATNGAYIVTVDLRGVFTRFLDGGRGLDSGRLLGSYQSDLVGSHSHRVANGRSGSNSPRPYILPSAFGSGDSSGGTSWADVGEIAGGAETRPKNVALLGCIKY